MSEEEDAARAEVKRELIASCPVAIPKKSRALARAPDVWLAIWLERDDLSPSERRKLQEVRDQRRNASKECRVGVLVGNEGVTPEQFETLRDLVIASAPSEIHCPYVATKVHTMLKRVGVPVIVHRDARITSAEIAKEVVKEADVVIAAPKESSEPLHKAGTGVWEGIKYSKHRSVPIRIAMPYGGEMPDA